jgi:hypothetical protein
MKFLKAALFVGLLGLFWSTSSAIKIYRLEKLVQAGLIPYGPVPDISPNYYSFNGLHAAFDSNLKLRRSEEFSKKEFENLILNSLEPMVRENFETYLRPTLSLSEEYQMDPFWVISVMMVESGFNAKALSSKNAKGLMQIQPDTAEHLYSLMGKKLSDHELNVNLHRPQENIEIGIFYLKKLLQNFRLNYRLATIAYNVGPNKLKDLLVFEDIDTVNFSYLVKVQDSYKLLTKNFQSELKKRPLPFELTFVVKEQGRKLEEGLLILYTLAPAQIKGNYLLTSENLSSNPHIILAF